MRWNKLKLKRFKAAYNEARKGTPQVFTFDGHEFLVGYAKYLIEYLEKELDHE